MNLPMGKHPLLRGNERYVTAKELALILGFSHSTVCRWCEDGRVRAYKPANTRHWRISRSEAVRLEREFFPDEDEEEIAR